MCSESGKYLSHTIGPGESGVSAVHAVHTILALTFGKINEELRSLLETLVL